jgi:predicted ferric reductase
VSDFGHTFWYLCRAAGVVAYVLAFASTALGLSMTGDVLERWLRRHRVYDLHRFLSLLTLGFVVLHVFVVLPDRYFSFTVWQLLLPFASPYRPLYMTLGVFALYALAVVVGSFYVRGLVRYLMWRLVHYATFAVFVLSLAHAIGAGADAHSAWLQYTYAGTALVVFNLGVYRLLRGSARGIPVSTG